MWRVAKRRRNAALLQAQTGHHLVGLSSGTSRSQEPTGKEPEGTLASLGIHLHAESHLRPRAATGIYLFIQPPTELFHVPSTTPGTEPIAAENERHSASPDTAYEAVSLLLRDSRVLPCKSLLGHIQLLG